jgi:hypothetical protein
MLINAKGRYGKHLTLGIQTNPGNAINVVELRARQWAPNNAKSCTICFRDTDYHGLTENHPTGFATIEVRYFTTAKEGLTAI